MEWKISHQPVEYETAIAWMETRVAAIREQGAEEAVWLLEHPPLYTAGSSARPEDLLNNNGFPVYEAGRGGQYTYHGPGQRVVYVMLDLKKRGADIRLYVQQLEECIIRALAVLAVKGEVREGRVGVWVHPPEAKIAAIGVRVRKWVTYHGVAVNICPDLRHYAGIVPCGIREYGVTSLQALGVRGGMEKFDAAFRSAFEAVFGEQAKVAT